MRRSILAVIVAVVALAALGGVIYSQMNKEEKKTDTTSSSSDNQHAPAPQESTNKTTEAPMPKTGDDAAATSEVKIVDFEYSPKTITVKKGTKVTWTNQDSTEHTVTGRDGGPDSAFLAKGETYSFTFDDVGTFEYFCKPHPNMVGTVVVTE